MISLQTPYFTVHSDSAGFVVRLQRTNLDYADIPAMDRDMETINTALDRLGRERKNLCIDWREGPLRNDAPFEEALRRSMPRLVRGYRAVAIIVRSAVSALQIKRQLREASLYSEVFQDEADAFDYLRGSSGVMSRRPTPIPGIERTVVPNSRGERISTAQMQAVERVPPTVGTRNDRQSSLPPLPVDRTNAQGSSRDRVSTLPPQPGERTSQPPAYEDRPSSLPPPPPTRFPRSS